MLLVIWTGINDRSVVSSVLSLDLSTSGYDDYAIDIRDSAVQWINDIENDSKYKRWSPTLMDLLKPTFPGMLRSIRRNLYNLVSIKYCLKTFLICLINSRLDFTYGNM